MDFGIKCISMPKGCALAQSQLNVKPRNQGGAIAIQSSGVIDLHKLRVSEFENEQLERPNLRHNLYIAYGKSLQVESREIKR